MSTNTRYAISKAIKAARSSAAWLERARAAKATKGYQGVIDLNVSFAREDHHSMLFWLRKAREWGAI